jgi:hypothetical protein
VSYLRSRAPITDHLDASTTLQSLVDLCARSPQLFLDVVDAYLQETHRETDATKALRQLLTRGGSVWTVAPDKAALQRAVAPQTQIAFERATSVADVASKELGEAWANAYGRDPDPSDAWDHAIKAVEAILREIISPDNNSATLGTLIRDLRDGAHKFEFVLTNGLGGVPTFVAMLQLLYPNPDRHAGPNNRKPTLEEARAVVQLAVTIVRWGRDGDVVRR